MLLRRAAVPQQPSYTSHLLDEKSRTVAGKQRSTAQRTCLSGDGLERPKMPCGDRRRYCQPRSYPVPLGEDRICLKRYGAFEGIFIEMVEDAGKSDIHVATWVWGLFCEPVAGRFGCGLHPEPRGASSDRHVRGRISFIPQGLPGGF